MQKMNFFAMPILKILKLKSNKAVFISAHQQIYDQLSFKELAA